jgi:hypothetical protein
MLCAYSEESLRLLSYVHNGRTLQARPISPESKNSPKMVHFFCSFAPSTAPCTLSHGLDASKASESRATACCVFGLCFLSSGKNWAHFEELVALHKFPVGATAPTQSFPPSHWRLAAAAMIVWRLDSPEAASFSPSGTKTALLRVLAQVPNPSDWAKRTPVRLLLVQRTGNTCVVLGVN